MIHDSLIIRVASRLCALDVNHVDEILRPPAVERLVETPSFIRGASIVRGLPTPIVDLLEFLTGEKLASPRRAVTVKLDGGRRAALLVSDVIGVRTLDSALLGDMPPLLNEAAPDAIRTLGRLDDQLLTVLRLGRLVPDGVWDLLSAPPGARR